MLILFLLVTAALAQDAVRVNTTEGSVEGNKAPDGDYYTFYDIPYAGPTTGENRFKAPVPPSPYPGVFHAINSNIICAQPTARGLIGVENCLTLSVFTKNVTTPKPVFVWINAEEYTATQTTWHSYRNIVEQDILFVKLNFRVSVFGFLCLGVPEAPGNAGLRDIIQGLKWVKENIANFGGDPTNVVLIGHGSGASLVDLITMSPRAENLVNKAIALSGSALAPWAVAYDPIGYANLFGLKLSYTEKSPQKLAQLLQTTNIDVMAVALDEFRFTNNTPLFAPCIENPNLNPNETVVVDAPINILRSGNYSQIPYIGGYTSQEGSMRASEVTFNDWLTKMQNNFSNFLPVDVNVTRNQSLVQDIRQFYFSESPIDMTTVNDFIDYQGDTLVLTSVIRGAQERAATSNNTVRLLEFAYRGTMNSDWTYPQIPLTGARHGAFLNFLFNDDLRPADEPIMRSLLNRFTRFAYTGVPSANQSTVIWPAINPTTVNYLYYGGVDVTNGTSVFMEEARTNPHTTRMTFWRNIYEKYYVEPSRVSGCENLVAAVLLVLVSQMFVRLL